MKLIILLTFTTLNYLAIADGLSFEKAWVRAVPSVSRVSAGFGILNNSTNRDRKLIKVESNISKVVELHTHRKKSGIMKMRPVEFIKVNKNSSTALKRLSYHIMFIDLIKPLKVGQRVPIKLTFDNGEVVSQDVEVKKL